MEESNVGQSRRRYTEEEVLSILTGLAGGSLSWTIGEIKESRTKLYFLMNTRYSEGSVGGHGFLSNNLGGREFPEGIEKFVEEKATEPKCLGLVPITKEAHEAVLKAGMQPIVEGILISPENYKPVVYALV